MSRVSVWRRVTLPDAIDIRRRFRAEESHAMAFVSDLPDREPVKANVEALSARSADRSMPCGETSPPDRLTLFRQWVDAGMPAERRTARVGRGDPPR